MLEITDPVQPKPGVLTDIPQVVLAPPEIVNPEISAPQAVMLNAPSTAVASIIQPPGVLHSRVTSLSIEIVASNV